MKKSILAFLISISAFSQTHTIQIELVNPEIGHVVASTNDINCGTSNDAGLNSIFEAHNVGWYCRSFFIAYPSLLPVEGGLITCSECDPNQLISDLEAYSSVIGRARLTPGWALTANSSYANFMDPPALTGSTPTHVAITDNPALNAIFEQFTVFSYEHVINNWYNLLCDCYSPDLIAALIDQGFILPNSINPETGETIYDNYGYQPIVFLLSTENPEPRNLKVFPNPFSENLQIEYDGENAQYSLFDFSGKLLTRTSLAEQAMTTANQLPAGLYFLKVQEDGSIKTVKLIKR